MDPQDLDRLEADLRALGRATPGPRKPALVRRILAATSDRTRRPALPWIAAAAAAAFFCLLLWPRRPEAPEPAPLARNPEAPAVKPLPLPPPERIPNLPVPPPPAPPVPAPTPAPVPAPLPAPDPVPPPPRPEPPAPPPAPAPAPAPAPTRPTIPSALLADVDGLLEIQDDKTWSRVQSGQPWTSERGLRTGSRPARFTLPDGTRVILGRSSSLRLVRVAPPELALDKGHALFEVVPGGAGFAVAVPQARLDVTGTRFSVRLDGHAEIVVSSGEVVVANAAGSVRVPAGSASVARAQEAPRAPRPVDADRLCSWARELDPPERVRLRFDFEDGKAGLPWTSGRPAPGPARGLNRGSLEGAPSVDADLRKLDRKMPVLDAELELRFRYWITDASQVTVQLHSERVGDNFRVELRRLGKEKWEEVRLPLADFFRLADGSRLQRGDRLTWFNLHVADAKGPVFFDDVELVEILR